MTSQLRHYQKISTNRFLWLVVNIMTNILSNYTTTNLFTLTFRSLSEAFVRRKILFSSSSGSCYGKVETQQEFCRKHDVCNCPRHGSWQLGLPFGYTPIPLPILFLCLILCPILLLLTSLSHGSSGLQDYATTMR